MAPLTRKTRKPAARKADGRKPDKGDDTQAILRHWREAVPNDRLAHLVKDATRALLRSLQMRLNEQGVSLGHWTFLRVLWEQDGLTQRELSARVGVMEPTTFSALQAMERLGYVTRSHMADDRKKMFVFLTPLGRQLKHRLVPLAEDVNEIAARGIRAADIATTRQTLLTILENLALDEAGSSGRIPSTREIARRHAEGRGASRTSRAGRRERAPA